MLYYDLYYLLQVEELEISGSGCSKRSLVSSEKTPSSGKVARSRAFMVVLVPAEATQSVWTGSQLVIAALLMV
jgi:hypothetical protein